MRPLPSLDHLARALLMRGSRDAAMSLLEAGIARGGDDKPRCEILLAAIRARPTDRVSGPPITLDANLVEELAATGRIREARALASGFEIGRSALGMEIARALEHVCDDPQLLDAPWRGRWEEVLSKGSMTALSTLEREVAAGVRVPPWLRDRIEIAGRLLGGFSLTSRTDVREPAADEAPALPEDARRTLAGLIARRDLSGALREVRAMAAAAMPGAADVASGLSRLLAAAERAQAGDQPHSATRTMPMEGTALGLLHLKMGSLDDAEKGFRKVVLESPSDHVAREYLADLVAVRRSLSPPSASMRPSPSERQPQPATPSIELDRTPAPDWLDKKRGKSGMQGWAARPKAASPPVDLFPDDDPATSVMRSDHEAELLLKAGHPERARQLYGHLVERFPDSTRFAERLEQIDQIIATRSAPIAMEPTVRKASPGIRSRDSEEALAPTPSIGIERVPIPMPRPALAPSATSVKTRKIVPIR